MTTCGFFALVGAILFSLVASEQSCFYPDGRNATYGLSPCKSDAEVSHCCREADVCLTNGLCFSPGLGSIVRRGCTDRSWKSADCPNICTTDEFRSGDAVMTACGLYNSFCCGQDEAARSCCSTGNTTLAVQIAGGDPMFTETVTVTPTSCPTATGTGNLGATNANGSTVGCPTAPKTERNALIGLVAGFGLIMFVAAALAVYWRAKMNKKATENTRLEQEKHNIEQSRQKLEMEVAKLPIKMRQQVANNTQNAA